MWQEMHCRCEALSMLRWAVLIYATKKEKCLKRNYENRSTRKQVFVHVKIFSVLFAVLL